MRNSFVYLLILAAVIYYMANEMMAGRLQTEQRLQAQKAPDPFAEQWPTRPNLPASPLHRRGAHLRTNDLARGGAREVVDAAHPSRHLPKRAGTHCCHRSIYRRE